MSRFRRGLSLMVVLLVSFGVPLGQAEVGLAQEQVHPNIILILADDMRADDLRLMPKVQSRLMEKGMTFSNAFVTDPLCCPSRATILTGRYAHNHGVRGNEPIRGGFATFHDSGLEQRTVAVRLREAGYRTALFGKLLNGYCNPDQGCETGRDYVPPGWTDWHAWSGSRILNDNGTLHDFPDDSLVKDDVVRARVSRLLESWSASKPLFLYVSAKAPHGGTDVAERHASLFAEESLDRGGSFNEADLSDKPSYVRESGHLTESEVAKLEAYHRTRLRRLMAVDDLVGRVVAELEQKGELDNTYIFFTSDNGYLLGEHRLAYIKRVPYEESIRAPFVVRGPGVAAGTTRGKFVLNNDLAPTFKDLGGLSTTGDGHSLAPLLSNQGAPVSSWRDAFLVEGWRESYSDMPTYHGVRTREHLYVEYATGERELYDIQADPYQLENLAGTRPAQEAQLAARLADLRDCAGESCRNAEGF